jgi:regulator of protease activity HflC (stomatin/prohibitin superfamily)
MKRNWMMLLMLCVIALNFSACDRVPAGNVGVKVYLLGSDKGVDHEVLGTGRYFIGINEELYIFPTFSQNVVWTKGLTEGSPINEELTFQTMEGMVVSADVGMTYHIDPAKVSTIFQKYRKGIDEITHIFMRNTVRDAFVKFSSERPVEDVYGKGKADLLKSVEDFVSASVNEQGIVIEHIYLIGELRLPDTVIASLNKKIEASQIAQQRENEIREAVANADKSIAKAKGEAESLLAVARAQAQANEILTKSISPTLVKYKSIEKWDGKLPTITSEVIPMINIDNINSDNETINTN